MTRVAAAVIFVLGGPVAAGCGGDKTTGGACTDANHCVLDENGNATCAEGFVTDHVAPDGSLICVGSCDNCQAPDACHTATCNPTSGECTIDVAADYGLSCTTDTLAACVGGVQQDVYCPQQCLDEANEGYRSCDPATVSSQASCHCLDVAQDALACEIDTSGASPVRESYCAGDGAGLYLCEFAADAQTTANILWYYDCESICQTYCGSSAVACTQDRVSAAFPLDYCACVSC